MYIYTYIYIYIYIWGPISPVQGSKAGTPQIGPGDKNDFLRVPVSELFFNGLQEFPETLQRRFLACFSGSWDLLRTSKNIDSVSYIH